MKNSVLLTFMMLFGSAGIISAQPNPPDYYTGKNRISGDGYVYNVKYLYYDDSTAFALIIQNELNTIINTKPPQLPENLMWMTAYVTSKETENYFMSIAAKEIKELSQEYKEERPKSQGTMFFDNDLSAMIAVNPHTGQILEVYFSCHNTPATKAIHPDKFYQLEQYIKQNINVPLDIFSSNLTVQNQFREREWILTKIYFKFREMYPL